MPAELKCTIFDTQSGEKTTGVIPTLFAKHRPHANIVVDVKTGYANHLPSMFLVTLMLPSKPIEVLFYRDRRNRSPFQKWFEKLDVEDDVV